MIKKGILLSLMFFIFWGCNNERNGKIYDEGTKFPNPDHIIIVIEENHGFDQIIGSPDAPFINSLIQLPFAVLMTG